MDQMVYMHFRLFAKRLPKVLPLLAGFLVGPIYSIYSAKTDLVEPTNVTSFGLLCAVLLNIRGAPDLGLRADSSAYAKKTVSNLLAPTQEYFAKINHENRILAKRNILKSTTLLDKKNYAPK